MQVSHGIISLFLLCAALAIALGAIFPHSVAFGALYILITALCTLIMAYSYCAKCPCRHAGCGHVIFGRIAKILPERKQGPYTFWDILWTTISIATILLIPQIWLIDVIVALVLFWTFIILAVLDIVFFVCPDCPNKNCALNRNTTRIP
jgi:hypothetical protein